MGAALFGKRRALRRAGAACSSPAGGAVCGCRSIGGATRAPSLSLCYSSAACSQLHVYGWPGAGST